MPPFFERFDLWKNVNYAALFSIPKLVIAMSAME